MNPFLIPLYALLSLDFYKLVFNFKIWKSIKYFLCLSIITTLLFIVSFVRIGVPRIDELVEWVKIEMPLITVTPQGLMISEESPYVMNHPRLGPLVTFDTSILNATLDQLENTFVFVTQDKVYLKGRNNELRIINVLETIESNQRAPIREPLLVTPESVQDFYDGFKPLGWVILTIIAYPVFLIMKLLTALFYSCVAVLFNMMRLQKLNYSTLFNVSAFAMTASIILQWITILIPFLGRLPGRGFLSFVITSGYLYFAIKKTEEDPA